MAKIDALDYAVEPHHVDELRNVLVTRSGFCFQGLLPVKESYHYGYRHAWRRHMAIAYGSRLVRRAGWLDRDQTYCVAHNLWTGGYFHWLTEAVPRMLRVKDRACELTLLAPPFRNLAGVVEASVQPIGFRSMVQFSDGANCKLESLVLPSNPARKAEFDPAEMQSARALYTSAYGAKMDAGERADRIYVTRRKSRGRTVANESELEPMLAANGFRIVAFEDYSFAEQVSLMSSARILISIHGAGLTNLMFMPPGSVVVELAQEPDESKRISRVRRSNLANPSYIRLASVMGVNHFIEFCPSVPARSPSGLPDITVAPGAFRATLEHAVSAVV